MINPASVNLLFKATCIKEDNASRFSPDSCIDHCISLLDKDNIEISVEIINMYISFQRMSFITDIGMHCLSS